MLTVPDYGFYQFTVKRLTFKQQSSKPGIAGRGGDRARCVLTKTTDTFRLSSSTDGNGPKCEKYFLAIESSRGI